MKKKLVMILNFKNYAKKIIINIHKNDSILKTSLIILQFSKFSPSKKL